MGTVTPAHAYSDVSVAVTIAGGPFRPAYVVDTGNGKATVDPTSFTASLTPVAEPPSARVTLQSVGWQDRNELSATVPAKLPAGIYDLEVRDRRGNAAVAHAAFESLGPDVVAPEVSIVAPADGSAVAANTAVAVTLRADDGWGHLATYDWKVVEMLGPVVPCPLEPGATAMDCSSAFLAPMPADGVKGLLHLVAEATDSAGNYNSKQITIVVALAPMVTSVMPKAGPVGGMTRIVVTGANFVAGGTQILIDGVPVVTDGGDVVVSSSLMRGGTPPHDPGTFTVVVRTGSAEVMAGTFEYIAPPRVRIISPTTGTAGGATPVTIGGDHFRPETRVVFARQGAGAPLVCPVWQNDHRITGYAPLGTGTVIVSASDPIAGSADAGVQFTYDDTPDRDGGGGDPEAGATATKCDNADGGAP